MTPWEQTFGILIYKPDEVELQAKQVGLLPSFC